MVELILSKRAALELAFAAAETHPRECTGILFGARIGGRFLVYQAHPYQTAVRRPNWVEAPEDALEERLVRRFLPDTRRVLGLPPTIVVGYFHSHIVRPKDRGTTLPSDADIARVGAAIRRYGGGQLELITSIHKMPAGGTLKTRSLRDGKVAVVLRDYTLAFSAYLCTERNQREPEFVRITIRALSEGGAGAAFPVVRVARKRAARRRPSRRRTMRRKTARPRRRRA